MLRPRGSTRTFDNLSQMSEPPQQLSFTAFVLSLASTAAIHFGDLPDPMSGKPAEPNLDGASQMIEILSLLEQKTRGNLTAEERQVLEQVLYELRMRFVEASSGGKRIIEPYRHLRCELPFSAAERLTACRRLVATARCAGPRI